MQILFSDGAPLLFVSDASHLDVNRRIESQGRKSLNIQCWKANIILKVIFISADQICLYNFRGIQNQKKLWRHVRTQTLRFYLPAKYFLSFDGDRLKIFVSKTMTCLQNLQRKTLLKVSQATKT